MIILIYQIHLIIVQKTNYQNILKENNEWKTKMEENYLDNVKEVLDKNEKVLGEITKYLTKKTGL